MSTLNIMVVGTKDGIVMVESGAKEMLGEQVVGGDRVCARGDQEDLRGDRRPGGPGRKDEARPWFRSETDITYLNELKSEGRREA